MFFRLYGQHIVLIGICYLARVVLLLREIMVLIYLTRLCSVIFLPIQPCIFWGSSNNNGLFFSINLYKRIIFGFSVCFFSTIAFRKFKTRHNFRKTVCDFLKRAASRQEIVISKVYPRHPTPLKFVPLSGNHVHVLHTIWPSHLLG